MCGLGLEYCAGPARDWAGLGSCRPLAVLNGTVLYRLQRGL